MPPVTITRNRRDPDAVARLLAAVPGWFGVESANAAYVDAPPRPRSTCSSSTRPDTGRRDDRAYPPGRLVTRRATVPAGAARG